MAAEARHPFRTFLVILGVAFVAALLWAAATGDHQTKRRGVPLGNSITAAMPSGALPYGRVSGTCSHASVSNASQAHAADLVGHADVKNTGNIGITVTVTMTWPQLGQRPIAMTKSNVKVDYGQTTSVSFDRAVNQQQLTNFKNWQDKQNEDGCTYTGTMISTVGGVH
jgi:alpha-L-fucosidase